MHYLRRLHHKANTGLQRTQTNWSILLLLIVGASALTWYVLTLEQPDRYVATESITTESTDVATSTDNAAVSGESEAIGSEGADQDTLTYSGALRMYRDFVTGLEFQYPVEWGVVEANTEEGECPTDYTADDCAFRTFAVQDPSSGNPAVFLIAATTGHGQFPVPRGAFWGDQVHQYTSNWENTCRSASNCLLLSFENGLKWAKWNNQAVLDTSLNDTQFVADFYNTYQHQHDYSRFGFSSVELQAVFPGSEEVYNIVLETLELD